MATWGNELAQMRENHERRRALSQRRIRAIYSEGKQTMPRFFLADPSLISVSGHCWSYLRSLGDPVKEAGFEPVVLGNRCVVPELQGHGGATPLFQIWCDDRFGSHARTAAVHARAIRDDLVQAAAQFDIDANDVVLLNSLRHWPLSGVVDWLEGLPARRRPFVALVLHFTAYPDPEGPSDSVEFYRRAFRRIETSPARDHLLLLADSQELIDEYQSINDRLHYAFAPIPHCDEPLAPDAAPDGIVRLGCLGEARENKGFHLLPYLVNRVLESECCERVQFHLHAFTPDPNGRFFQWIAPRLDRPGVTLYREMFDDEHYRQFLGRLDIVLLPYTRANYHAQTSGVFAEAMAQQKAIVCPRGTWMARQVVEFGAGASFVPDDVEDLAQQTLSVIENLPAIQASGEQRSRRWRTVHNPHRLLATIFEAADRAAAARSSRDMPRLAENAMQPRNAARYRDPRARSANVQRSQAMHDAASASRLSPARGRP